MSISEQLVAENIALRQAVAQLTERVDDLHMGNVEEW